MKIINNYTIELSNQPARLCFIKTETGIYTKIHYKLEESIYSETKGVEKYIMKTITRILILITSFFIITIIIIQVVNMRKEIKYKENQIIRTEERINNFYIKIDTINTK